MIVAPEVVWPARDRAELATPIASSTMTFGGLVKHLAAVEDDWFHSDLAGNDFPAALGIVLPILSIGFAAVAV